MNENNNMPKVTVNTLIRELGQIYVNVMEKGYSFAKIPTPFVWGPPGVGKSEGIYQLSEYLRVKTGKKVQVTEVRLLLFSPIDLRGIPVPDKERELANWLKPRIFDMDPSEDVINILFLDELSAAPPSVQSAAYQLTLDRAIGEHRLPDNCIVIGAGNRVTDRSIAYRMPNALANRLQHYEVLVDFEAWKKYASMAGVSPLILGYLSFDNSKFYETELTDNQTVFATPRSWMFVSNLMDLLEDVMTVEEMYHQISACIGSSTALDFISWCKRHDDLPVVSDIFAGRRCRYPKSSDALYPLIRSMITYEKLLEDQLEQKTIHRMDYERSLSNMVSYVERFPDDYQACLYSDLCKRKLAASNLTKIPGFREWLKRQDLISGLGIFAEIEGVM